MCTKDRRKWLATEEYHGLLQTAWQEATGWLVARYVVMPDHVHLFAAPGEMDVDLDTWMRYWKRLFSSLHGRREHRWQAGHWDRRLRTGESYDEKWQYVRNNPVRHGLVAKPDDWPFQGELHVLHWCE